VAFSNTVSETVFTTRKVIDHAFRRCKLPPQAVTSEMLDMALDLLYLYLSALTNRGLQLWAIDRVILPLYEAQVVVTLPLGTVDVLNANLRTLSILQPKNTTETTTAYSAEFYTQTQVTTVGVLFDGVSTAYNIQVSNDGAAWTTVQAVANPDLVAGQWNWTDIDGALDYLYCRVVAATGTLNQSQVVFGNTPTEIPIARLNRDDYMNLPNKTFQGRPLQYWLNRTINQPEMNLWPAPQEQFTTAQITAYTKRYVMDVGSMTQELEIPQRWYNAIVYRLASLIADETPQVPDTWAVILDQKAERAQLEAETEERDDSPIYLRPNIAVYTR
jgi:hypothetical protein